MILIKEARWLSATWYLARPRRIIVLLVVCASRWGRWPPSTYFQHCSPHHWKEGEINLRNNKFVSLWSLPFLWLHVFSSKRGSGLEWNWNRRLLMQICEKLILFCTNQFSLRLTVSQERILGNNKTPMLTAPRLWCQQSFCIAQCSLEFLRGLLAHFPH